MGIRSCDRKDCENIMCDNYNKDIGYICNDCLVELRKLNPKKMEDIIYFMESPRFGEKYKNKNGDFSLEKVFQV
jgi:hypothetical protein